MQTGVKGCTLLHFRRFDTLLPAALLYQKDKPGTLNPFGNLQNPSFSPCITCNKKPRNGWLRGGKNIQIKLPASLFFVLSG